jgi:flagellar basal body-associated protein FliL
MKKKILIAVPVLLIVVGFAAKTFLLKTPVAKAKIAGQIYILPKPFTLNLQGGHYCTLTVALLLAPSQTLGTADPNNPPPDGFGVFPEEPVVRAIVTNVITGQPQNQLTSDAGRAWLQQQILSDIKAQTDDKVDQVLFTDVAVQ